MNIKQTPYQVCHFWYSQIMDDAIGHSLIEINEAMRKYTIAQPIKSDNEDSLVKPDHYKDFQYVGKGEFVNSTPVYKENF